MGLKETFVLPVAKRWIAGPDLGSAVKDSKKANSRGLEVVVNFLGEEIRDPATADSHTSEYLRLQQTMADESIRGKASVKLTQLGLLLDREQAELRLDKIAINAERLGQWLWIDMEGSKFTDATLDIYSKAHERHPHLGVAIQSYLKRCDSDLPQVLDRGGKVRLVKGAYREAPDLVFPTKKEVRESFIRAMAMLFERGDGFAIATHDSFLVDRAKRMSESRHVEFEFEMLKGIRDELKLDLVKSGYKVSEYLPYGDRWYAYSKRRITEHPGNIWLLLRSLV